MFDAMIDSIREDTVRMIFLAQVRTREEPKREQVAKETGAAGAAERFCQAEQACRQRSPARMIRARAVAARSIRNAATSNRTTV